ncbi:polysaccharide deacetylase family protein [Capillimicrobium parvum]|uniref:Uncharacterized protein n=1 Tax=Capillimicrobium parvum TaxID=2884022 RepID=A0A9E6Y1Y9_9ACTN|nr:hypothetical protein [Capillimicrobium parvum]UGS38702.1 hypothetical protein DSM104329_05132 [Capillimicrobium parvum]
MSGTSWHGEFSYAFLRELLEMAREREDVRLLAEGVDAPGLIVRHDIDLSLERAVAVGAVEQDAGVRATFLVMVDSPLYDLDEPGARAALARLREQGHDVGLHMDLGPRGERDGLVIEDVAPEVEACRERLAAVLGDEVRAISFHRPADPLVAALAPVGEVCGMVNAYAAPLMRCYLADSAGAWRHGDPRPVLRDPPCDTVQLLLHPFWWGEEHLSAAERLEAFYHERTAGLAPFDALAFDRQLATVVRRSRRTGLLSAARAGSLP